MTVAALGVAEEIAASETAQPLGDWMNVAAIADHVNLFERSLVTWEYAPQRVHLRTSSERQFPGHSGTRSRMSFSSGGAFTLGAIPPRSVASGDILDGDLISLIVA